MRNSKKTIIITGSSSGLGRAIAIECANSLDSRLFLFGRNLERLEETRKYCLEYSSEVHIIQCDVEDKNIMRDNILKIIDKYIIDYVIACAGVSAGTLEGPETHQQIEKIFSTNINGVINTILPCVQEMIKRQKGNIVIVSSMAGLLGLSSSPAYSASKAAVRVFGEAIHAYLKKYNVNVTVVLPGFVKTPMTDVNKFPMPFMISAENAAKKIVNGMKNSKPIIAFPFSVYILMKLVNILPNFFVSYINSKLLGKATLDSSGN